jgi:hypothetical protein
MLISVSWLLLAKGYGLDDQTIRVRFPANAGEFYILHIVQSSSEAHEPPIHCVALLFRQRIKRPGREADYTPPSVVKVRSGLAAYLLVCTSVSWFPPCAPQLLLAVYPLTSRCGLLTCLTLHPFPSSSVSPPTAYSPMLKMKAQFSCQTPIITTLHGVTS